MSFLTIIILALLLVGCPHFEWVHSDEVILQDTDYDTGTIKDSS